MISKQQLATVTEVLATTSVISIGWALGGTVGAAIMAEIGINLGSDMINRGSEYLKEKWLSAEYGVLNNDIQRALVRAFVEALVRLEARYFELPEANNQPRENKKAIRGLFKELREVAPTVFAASLERIATEREIKEYLYGEPLAAGNTLWKRVEGTKLLYTYYGDHVKTFLRNNINDELVSCFGEELKTDSPECNKAWRAFQRMLLEGIQSEVKTFQANHEAMREDLRKLHTIQTRLDDIKGIIDHRTPNEPFTQGLENGLRKMTVLLESVIQTTHRMESKVDVIVATSELTEAKIDTVGRTVVGESEKTREEVARVRHILEGIVTGQTSRLTIQSSLADSQKGSEKAERGRNDHVDRIRVYAQTVVEALTSLDHLELHVEIKAKSDSVGPAALTHILEEHPRLVIIGDRGAGKTTFMLQALRALCMTITERLENKPRFASLLVPVYAELGQLSHKVTGRPYQEGDLVRLLRDNLGYLPEEHPRHVLGELLDTFKIILFLDGLSELPADDQSGCRTELFRLDHTLASGGRGGRLSIAVSSRSLGFGTHSDEFDKKGWQTVDVLPLDLDDIKHQLTQSLGFHRGQIVFRRIDPKLRQILSTPQNLDHFMKWFRHRLEEDCKRGLDFNEIVEDIVRPVGTFLKHQVDVDLDKLRKQDVAFVEEILSHLAYETVKDGTAFPYSKAEPESGSRAQSVARDALSISNEILKPKNSKIDAEDLLAEISNSGILIIVKSKNLCRFEHQSFQEYFAACKMERLWKLDEYMADARWREPLGIMAGLLERGGLLELLRKVRPNPELYAYILAHVHEPQIEREFQASEIEQFVHTTKRWATKIAGRLRLLFGVWFLSIPFIAYLLSQIAGSSMKFQVLFSCLGMGYLFVFPLALIRWNNKQFRNKQERLRNYELKRLIAILKTLQARQAMLLVVEELLKLESRWDDLEFQEGDPRRAFVEHALREVRGAVNAPAYLTEDEMMEHLSDPLVAASIDLGVLSRRGIQSLYEKAANPNDDLTGMQAIGKLAELYVADSECRERVAQVFRAIGLNTHKRYSRQRRKYVAGICQKLQIPLGQLHTKRLSIIARVLAFLKRVWRSKLR